MKNQLVTPILAFVAGAIITGGICFGLFSKYKSNGATKTQDASSDNTSLAGSLNPDSSKFRSQPLKDTTRILSEINKYDLSYTNNLPNNLKPTKIIVHSNASFVEYFSKFQYLIGYLEYSLKDNDSIRTKYEWQVGIYPAISKDLCGNERINVYFIPTLCKKELDGHECDSDYGTMVLDYRIEKYRKDFYTIDKEYIYDAGNMWP